MAEFHPVRQAAEADFLNALEHLSGTFGVLDPSNPVSSEASHPLDSDEMAAEILAAPEAFFADSTMMPEAIAERYDSQTVRSNPKD